MCWICQLGGGYMLKKVSGGYSREYTGYPYPDTELSNIKALQELFRGYLNPEDIDKNPKTAINLINDAFDKNKVEVLDLDVLFVGSTSMSLLAEHNGWLLFSMSGYIESVAELCNYVFEVSNMLELNEDLCWRVLIHKDNSKLVKLYHMMGYSEVDSFDNRYEEFRDYFMLAMLHSDVSYISNEVQDWKLHTDVMQIWLNMWLGQFHLGKHVLPVIDGTFPYDKGCREVMLRCADFEKDYMDTGSELYRKWFGVICECCKKSIASDLEGGARLKYDGGSHILKYIGGTSVKYSFLDGFKFNPSDSVRYKEAYLFKRCYIGHTDLEIHFDLMKLCGHEALCDTVASYFLEDMNDEIDVFPERVYQGFDAFGKYFSSITSALSKLRFMDTEPDYIENMFDMLRGLDGVYDCSPSVYFLMVGRFIDKPVTTIITRDSFYVTMRPFEKFKPLGVSVSDEDMKRFLDTEMLSFVKIGCYFVLDNLVCDADKQTYRGSLDRDNWIYNYEINGLDTSIGVSYVEESE